MTPRLALWRGLRWALAALAGVAVILGLLIGALDAGYFRGPLIHLIGVRTGRDIKADVLTLHLFSRNPQLVAEGVTIGNPPWTPAGNTAVLGKITVIFSIPGSGQGFGIQRVDIQSATLHLLRDSTGHANWQRTNPDRGGNRGLPLIHSLSIPAAHVMLDDALKHLQFEGTASAVSGAVGQGAQPLRIEGTGRLNGKTATIEITGDPLLTANRNTPYRFSFVERSSGSQLTGNGALLRPFDFNALDASFEAAGADLKDLYYLVGVSFVNTGTYRFSGKLARRGNTTTYRDLAANFGETDIRGAATIDSSRGHSTIDVSLNSQLLRTADFGLRAAGRAAADPHGLLLSTAMLDPGALHRNDGNIKFRAARVQVARVVLEGLSANITLDRGVVTVHPVLADMLGGKLSARLTIDARGEVPVSVLDLKIADLELGQLPYKGSGAPPLEGPLQVSVAVTGRGKSLHQAAASANGTLTAQLAHGIMRDSLAELAGVDLRAARLIFEKSRKEVAIRCAAVNFQARDGALTAHTLLIDSEPMLITGEGRVSLDTEEIDLQLRGQPKGVRILRWRAPLLLRGTLAHPSFAIQEHNSALVLLDRGRTPDADCAALLAPAASSAERP